ncbi:hypothetical protein MNB_SV-3-1220 [hydrothermal vent metagenome]|uniref:Uncharacterized protein n=1 Tax=hydrothermal vent metagenome TaxID=652676 RepID=A0A1W1CNG4_9ZZZZ
MVNICHPIKELATQKQEMYLNFREIEIKYIKVFITGKLPCHIN